MKAASDTIGYVIAYIAPGSVVLWGMSKFSTEIDEWIHIASTADASVGSFLFVALASLALGIFVSGVRWLLVDHLLELLGTKQPDLDMSKLKDPGILEGFNRLSEGHYRFYQFYANMLVALITSYAFWIADLDVAPWRELGALIAVLLVSVCLFFSARDALKKYYRRSMILLGEVKADDESRRPKEING